MPLVLIVLGLIVRTLSHVMGTDDPSGFFYLWWSGFFPDILIFVGGLAWLRHHRCEKDDCRYKYLPLRRFAFHHYQDHLLCGKHHPARRRINEVELAHLWHHHHFHAAQLAASIADCEPEPEGHP